MSPMNKLINCFVQTLAIDRSMITDELAYQSIPQWDSMNHLALVVEIENAFGVTFNTDDIIAMRNVANTVAILQKHGVVLDTVALTRSR